MRYVSTRGHGEPQSFRECVLAGPARDGGLAVPEHIPDVRDRLESWRTLTYPELAWNILDLFAGDSGGEFLEHRIREAYAGFSHPAITPVRRLGKLFLLELFHGPTLAFKDIALQLLGRFFSAWLEEEKRELNILTATSGDTGSAAIHAVRGSKRMRIFVLHPFGRVSPVQERQMTTVTDANVFNLAVDGTFDDCQRVVKILFNDLAFRDRYHLAAMNSINIARILAQVVYYFHAALRVMDETGAPHVRFAVPTGNFGDIYAGYLASRMGLPIDRLVLATNENDILSRFFQTGIYRTGNVVPTLSPSMDIQVASNLERYLYDCAAQDGHRVAAWMKTFETTGTLDLRDAIPVPPPLFAAERTHGAAVLETIRLHAASHHVLLDPHTAVGVCAAEKHLSDAAPMIALATAHPAKFPEAIREALGEDRAHHPSIDALRDGPTRVTRIAADPGAIADFVRTHAANQTET